MKNCKQSSDLERDLMFDQAAGNIPIFKVRWDSPCLKLSSEGLLFPSITCLLCPTWSSFSNTLPCMLWPAAPFLSLFGLARSTTRSASASQEKQNRYIPRFGCTADLAKYSSNDARGDPAWLPGGVLVSGGVPLLLFVFVSLYEKASNHSQRVYNNKRKIFSVYSWFPPLFFPSF